MLAFVLPARRATLGAETIRVGLMAQLTDQEWVQGFRVCGLGLKVFKHIFRCTVLLALSKLSGFYSIIPMKSLYRVFPYSLLALSP